MRIAAAASKPLNPLVAFEHKRFRLLSPSSTFTFMLAGHVVGSCWYLFGLQRVNQCLRNACGHSDRACRDLIDCGRGDEDKSLAAWRNNTSAIACFDEDGRRLPEGIRRRVREAERFNWAATRGVNEELLFENMHDDLIMHV